MSEKKLWAHGDARAEMNQAVVECKDALKVLHAAADKIKALGTETGFQDDALRALAHLRDRAAFNVSVKIPAPPSKEPGWVYAGGTWSKVDPVLGKIDVWGDR